MNLNATMIGQMITFALFVWFTWKMVWPPVIAALDERQRKIASGLAAAEEGERDRLHAREEASKMLEEVKHTGAQLIDKANKRCYELVEEAKLRAKEEGERLIASAKVEIQREIQIARTELQKQVVDLVVAGTERLLRKEVDSSSNRTLIEQMMSELKA